MTGKMNILRYFAVLIGMVMWWMGAGVAHSANINVLNVAFTQEKSAAILTLSSTSPFVNKRAFILREPLRLVLDVDRISNANVVLPPMASGTLVKSLRFGQFSPQTSRFVMELNAELGSYTVQQRAAAKGKPNQLYVTMLPHNRAATYRQTRVGVNNGVNNEVNANTQKALIPSPKKNELRRNRNVPMVVIDAGHGGKDPGAVASNGVLEKDITLNYALALRDALKSTGRYQVALTRSDDTFILLHERVKIAREAGGNIMVALHADTAPQAHARGLSIYTVSEEASDAEAAALAKQENAVDDIGEIQFATEHPEVADILIDLASRDTRIKSTELALLLVQKVKAAGLVLLKNPNRYAGFRVLKSPDVPSVLIELGFLSNASDEVLLQNAAHRSKVVQALVGGIDAYFVKHPHK
jgi:N-acetylmuramoyl-L-alanine amidase